MTPDTEHIHLLGSGLASEDGPPDVRLNGEPVLPFEADDERIVVAVPRHITSATLEVTLPDGQAQRYDLQRDTPGGALAEQTADPWLAERPVEAG